MKRLIGAGIVFGLVAIGLSAFWNVAAETRTDVASSSSVPVVADPESSPIDFSRPSEPEVQLVIQCCDTAPLTREDNVSRRQFGFYRANAFADFHARQTHDFASFDTSFGFMRMSEMQAAMHLNHSASGRDEPLKLKESGSSAEISQNGSTPSSERVPVPFPDHDLLFPIPFPIVNEARSTTGFTPVPCNDATSISRWELSRLELIGLVKHDPPVAYVSREIPRMSELNAVRTAPLNEFEQQAIHELKSNPNQDVAIQDQGDRIQMVGALRAQKVCANCHSVEQGHLLGALTYQFVRQEQLKDEDGTAQLTWMRPFLADVTAQWQARPMPFLDGRDFDWYVALIEQPTQHKIFRRRLLDETIRSSQLYFPGVIEIPW